MNRNNNTAASNHEHPQPVNAPQTPPPPPTPETRTSNALFLGWNSTVNRLSIGRPSAIVWCPGCEVNFIHCVENLQSRILTIQCHSCGSFYRQSEYTRNGGGGNDDEEEEDYYPSDDNDYYDDYDYDEDDDHSENYEMSEEPVNVELRGENQNSTAADDGGGGGGGGGSGRRLPDQLTEESISEYLSKRDIKESINKQDICVVCQNEFSEEKDLVRLDCNHDFHDGCIKRWLLNKNSCPLCVGRVIPSSDIN